MGLLDLRPLDRRLHFTNPQTIGEYFGKDCGTRSIPRGQGSQSGVIYTDQDVYPLILPKSQRQVYRNDVDAPRARRGDRSMHRTTIDFNKSEKSDFSTSSKEEYGGLKRLIKSAMPHACRSMHTSQIVLGKTPGFQKSTMYCDQFTNKYSEPHYKVLEPLIENKVAGIESLKVAQCLKPDSFTRSLTEYGSTHKKLGAMLDSCHPKYPIPKPQPPPRHYNVITGEDIGASWVERNHRTSGNRVLHQAIIRETSGFLF